LRFGTEDVDRYGANFRLGAAPSEPLLGRRLTPLDRATSHPLAFKAFASLALGLGPIPAVARWLDVSVVSTLRRASKWLPHLDRRFADLPG
jgi:hypothetical protein